MLHSKSTVKMSEKDINRFFERMAQERKGEISTEERERRHKLRKRGERLAFIVRKNNGGIDPILGY